MAAITPIRKNGKIVSYKFRTCLGRNEAGKQIFKCTTWKIPEGLIPSKQEKAAHKAAEAWEHHVKEEYRKDVLDPERITIREICKKQTTFSSFVWEIWYPISICNGEHKPTTIEFYRNISKVITGYFDKTLLQNISSTDIDRYLIYLHTQYKTKQGKALAAKTIRHHYNALGVIFSFALNREYILANPMEKVACPKIQKKKLRRSTRNRRRHSSPF